jgi:hypothetical protein
MNRERLEHMRTVLQDVKQRRLPFNLDVWAQSTESDDYDNTRTISDDHACGTVCCAIGWAAFDSVFQQAGLRLQTRIFGSGVKQIVDTINDLNDCLKADPNAIFWPTVLGSDSEPGSKAFNIVGDFLGINPMTAEHLFSSEFYSDGTPDNVIDRINRVLAGLDAIED